ncbi:MAG TPA: DnaJ domain-containing protein [Candidatus Dormibacteraeota bacterium]|nr:DnaJ domain-containing protein [Candidatus Dormibacteraeota bacterium]
MQYSDGLDDGDLYGLLGLLPGASEADLRQARRVQAQRWHPDLNKHKDAQSRMAAINNACRVLSDRAQREAYDETLRSLTHIGQATRATRSKAGAVTLTSYLQVRGFGVVDNRLRGGVLWVVDRPALEPVMAELRHQGIDFEYAATGGMATDHRPAWWTRTWG